jgi:hypothetical protein
MVGQQPGRPVRHAEVVRWWLQRGDHDDDLVMHPRSTGPVGIGQRIDPAVHVALAPGHHGLPGGADPSGDLSVRHAFRGQQHDPGLLHQTRRRSGRLQQPRQSLPISITKHDPHCTRRHTPFSPHTVRLAINDTRH